MASSSTDDIVSDSAQTEIKTEATMAETKTDYIIPDKSPQDKRSYRILTLPNKLQVVLVHDPETEKASAALSVQVGHFCNPDTIPGLAHFLEHMLFLGTKKYPGERDYHQYLSEHGGSNNASTAEEETQYYFDVDQRHLYGALDRFAQFFIAPLFNESAIEREMNAVQKEFALNLQNDSYRNHFIFKHTCNPKHPFAKFSIGNLQTLRDDPKKQGIDVQQELRKFYAKYYSANLMKLSIAGKDSLDTLEQWALQLFGPIVNTDCPVPVFPKDMFIKTGTDWLDPSCRCMSTFYRIAPIADFNSMEIMWFLPPTSEFYHSKPTNLIANVMGHEGPGSLISVLKAKGWVDNLTIGGGCGCDGGNSCFTMFYCFLDLTTDGFEHVDDIIEIVYQFLSMMRNTSDETWETQYNEALNLCAMGWTFQEPQHITSLSPQLSSALVKFKPRDILTGPRLYKKFDMDLVKTFLHYMTHNNMRIHLMNRKFKDDLDQVTEPWYGAKYKMVPFSETLIDRCFSTEIFVTENKELKWPSLNEFLATDFTLKHKAAVDSAIAADMLWLLSQTPSPSAVELSSSTETISLKTILPSSSLSFLQQLHSSEPRRIDGDAKELEGIHLWFKADTAFLKPKASIDIRLDLPHTNSPRVALLNSLYAALVNDSLYEYSYNASKSGCQYSLHMATDGMSISLAGYNQNLHKLLKCVLERVRDIKVQEERFNLIKQQFKRSYENWSTRQPYAYAYYTIAQFMTHGAMSQQVQVDALETLELDDLRKYIKRFMRKQAAANITVFVYGNMTESEALDIGKMVRGTFPHKPLAPWQVTELRSIQLTEGTRYLVKMPHTNPNDVNSSVLISFQIGVESCDLIARVKFISHVLAEAMQNQLRTKEQLGYLLSCVSPSIRDVLMLEFLIQGDDKTPEYMDTRIEALIDQFHNMLDKMDDETFDKHKAAILLNYERKEKSPFEESARLWSEIDSKTYVFNRKILMADAVKRITRQAIWHFWTKYIIIGAPCRKKFSVHIHKGDKGDKGVPPLQTLPAKGDKGVPPLQTLPNNGLSVESKQDGLDIHVSEIKQDGPTGVSPEIHREVVISIASEIKQDVVAEIATPLLKETSDVVLRPAPKDDSPLVIISDCNAFRLIMPLYKSMNM